MPYDVVKRGDKWCLKNKDTGEIGKGRCHDTKELAISQMRAILGSEHGWKPTGEPRMSQR